MSGEPMKMLQIEYPYQFLINIHISRGGGVLWEFLGGDMLLGLWNPWPIPELVSAGFCYPMLE